MQVRSQAVHPHIFRLHYTLDQPRPRRPWNVALLHESVEGHDFQFDGRTLRHAELGELLHFCAEPEARTVTLADLPGLVTRDGDRLPDGPASQEVTLRLRRAPELRYYGLGQRVHGLRRDPGTYCNWTVDPEWGHHRAMPSLYQAHPYFLACRPGLALGVFLNSTWYSRFDLGDHDLDEITITTLGGEADLHVLVGRTPAEVCARLADLTGHAALPPTWALGYHQSRWGYREQSEIEDLVREFQQRDIPLDVLHLDIDYMDDYRSFSFHPQRFPDPAGLTARLREQGVRVVTIIDPGIRFDLHSSYPVAREGAQLGHFLRNADGSPFSAYCWPDAALFTDYTSADARAWWGQQQRFLLERGVSGIWIDMNEPAIFTRPFSEGFSKQNPMPLALQHSDGALHAEVHNLYGHLMAQATCEGMEEPWVLTRSAFVGTQRFAFAWMGDNNSWWEHLGVSLPQLISMGLSGAPFVGVDVGGFFGNTTGELLARWMELAAFYPFMRNHSAVGTRPQEPWRFGPEVEALVRAQIQLRYRFLPYVEELARRAHEHGEPLLRPLFYEFPDDPDSYVYEDQAFFGPWLMLAPMLRAGHSQRQVYFPPGRWYDFWSDASYQGPSMHVCPGPLGQMPIFLREGACIPMAEVRRSTAEPIRDPQWLLAVGPKDTERPGLRRQGSTVTAEGPCRVTLRTPEGRRELRFPAQAGKADGAQDA